MTIIKWADWPELQKRRVLKEIALHLSVKGINLRHQIICGALYELYPYGIRNEEYNQLVLDIYADLRRNRKQPPEPHYDHASTR